MSCDLLPEWLNLILDDVESTLCLPILIVMLLCTAQFIVNHTMDIGCTFYQSIKQDSDEDEEKGEDLITKFKGILANWGIGQPQTNIAYDESSASQLNRQNSQDEDWDYCEEDDE
ncbi:uncharacterized protein LOC117222051 [Megalopta genalis]|uniref:uncharacterized protein LOC117222051 n=1 Tax=Megalopta genalis TaxID=115081 RepID=UPI003FD2863A